MSSSFSYVIYLFCLHAPDVQVDLQRVHFTAGLKKFIWFS